jgi:hypothetical protein
VDHLRGAAMLATGMTGMSVREVAEDVGRLSSRRN